MGALAMVAFELAAWQAPTALRGPEAPWLMYRASKVQLWHPLICPRACLRASGLFR